MNGHTTRTVIATGTWVTLGVALSAALGIVPRAGDSNGGSLRLISSEQAGGDATLANLLYPQSQGDQVWAPAAHAGSHRTASASHAVDAAVKHHAHHSHAAHVHSAVATTPTSTQPGATDASSSTTTHHTTTHHQKKTTHKKPPKKVVVSTLAARTTPDDSEISNAITGLKKYIHTPFSVNSSEVNTFGNDVCSAFDAKKTFAQVEDEINTELKKLPYTTVDAGGVDFVVHTAVSLYCPGYTSRLG